MNKDLTDEQKNILYNSGTEMPGTSDLLYEKRPGTYVTADTVSYTHLTLPTKA